MRLGVCESPFSNFDALASFFSESYVPMLRQPALPQSTQGMQVLLHHLRQPYHSLSGFARLHQIEANMAICQGKGLVNRLGSSLSLANP